MSGITIKLKKAKASTRLAYFDVWPSWGDLASKIVRLYGISPENVSVTFLDEAKDIVTIAGEEELQYFYEHHYQSPKETKFVVQDLQFPDSALASTWSADSNLSGLSGDDDRLTLFCLVLNASTNTFPVDIGKTKTVGHLKNMIKKEMECTLAGIEASTLNVWKLSPPIPSAEIGTKLRGIQSPQWIPGCVKLDATNKILKHFPSVPDEHVHIIAEAPPTVSRKHPRSLSAQGDGEAKKKRLSDKTWCVNGGITVNEAKGRYYVDPGMQEETKLCLDAVIKGRYLLLAGARASGKTTRLLWLRQKLEEMDYYVLYISFDRLHYRGSTEQFWESFGITIEAKCRFGLPNISSRSGFISYFYNHHWDQKVVLLIDEFSSLYQANNDVRDDCLEAFRGLKQDPDEHAVQCIIAAGTFSIISLNPSNSEVSPFNVADVIQCPYFTIDEARNLFCEFAQDLGYLIDDAVVEDIWTKSNGHPGMLCLCGRTIFQNMHTLICHESRAISYELWQQFPEEELYDQISSYNTFNSMVQSLSRAENSSSIDLLRSQFAGFLGDVTLTDRDAKKDADILTSEGVLLKPDHHRPCYRMSSPLVDGLIRNQLIPAIFRSAPSSPIPYQQTGDVDVLHILVESLKFFDKALICTASSCSYKTPKVKVPTSHGCHVPRESVYNTELMRILANWLRKCRWSVNGQWHLENHSKRHKYSDIVLSKDGWTIVLELLATGEPSSVRSHIQKTPEYATLLSADEAWVIHFTCQEDYHPIWQSDMNVNVVHFAHDMEFTNVVMNAHWKDCTGVIRQEVSTLLL